MNFYTVARAFQEIQEVSSRIEITKTLAELFKKADPQEIQELCYLSLGVLNPPYKGTQFAIAQKTMIKVVARVLALSELEVKKLADTKGDLGLVMDSFEVSQATEHSVGYVYKKLVEIEHLEGTGSQEQKIQMLCELLESVDMLSAKFIVRIVLGTLRLGFSDMTLLDALSWMEVGDKSLKDVLEHAYNICADIGLLARTLKQEGYEAVKKMQIHIGIPIRPAAAERLESAQAIIDKIGPCVAQPKLDGFRLQVHVDLTKKEPLIRFFSRNSINMSYMFPDLGAVCKKLPVKTVILDSEAIVYDPNTGTFMPFQETVKRKRKYGIDQLVSELPLQLNIFDIMYLDGKSLLHEHQKTRRAHLKDLFNRYTAIALSGATLQEVNEEQSTFLEMQQHSIDQIPTLVMIEEKYVTTASELTTYFNQEISQGLEGVVVKKTDSVYQAGKRNFNWIKLKYESTEKLKDSIDAVILGYYPGRGKRAHFGIGAFLVGIYNKKTDQFETIAKVGTGLSDQEWKNLKASCDTIKVSQKPSNVECAKELVPAVWVTPSLVVELLADEITQSPLHTVGKSKDTLGLALRFPRFIGYRPDKSPSDTTTVQELAMLRKSS